MFSQELGKDCLSLKPLLIIIDVSIHKPFQMKIRKLKTLMGVHDECTIIQATMECNEGNKYTHGHIHHLPLVRTECAWISM